VESLNLAIFNFQAEGIVCLLGSVKFVNLLFLAFDFFFSRVWVVAAF
jgi:hypothetical protein